jgi:arginyl-tRNA synthetase
MQIKLENLISSALTTLQQKNILRADLATFPINLDPPKNSEYGDFSSNIALLIAKATKTNPMAIATAIVAALPQDAYIETTKIAKPGFINFYLTNKPFQEVIATILTKTTKYGHTNIGANKLVMVEFVSANPTGPLHVGHGRGAAFGTSVADLLESMGFKVHREYYVNDAGRQMHVLALSVWLRYLELYKPLQHFPDSGYKGSYIIDIAQNLKTEYGETFIRSYEMLFQDLPVDETDGGDKEFYVDALIQRAQAQLGIENYQLIFQAALNSILIDIREDLEEFGVNYQEWFYESSLIKLGDVNKGIEKLRQQGHVYEKDGATWFRATTFGDEKDRVLVKSNKQTTYFASDIGYHLNKYERGFDKIIDVFGADHHGYAPRIKGFLQAMALDVQKLEVLLVQFAILYHGKQKVSMSTRSGEFVTLRTLREEVGNDAARFFYIMRKNDQHLDFDLDLAKSKSLENPVFYIQYAHARICSVMRQMEEKNLTFAFDQNIINIDLLNTEHEKILMRDLLHYSDILQTSALKHEPHLLAHYLHKLASNFHAYYNAYQFIVEDQALRNARLCLVLAIRQIIANGLILLGIATPETM